MLRRTLRCATLLASLLAATPGCSGGSAASRGLPGGDAGDDAGAQLPSPGTADAAPDAAPPQTFVPLPQVPFQGGPTIAHVKLVTITFAGYPYQQQMQAFGDWIVGSTWLQTVGAEYGVGTGTHVAKLVVDYTPPAVLGIEDIQAYLAYGITSHVFPQPDADTLYVIYYPPGTTPSGAGCAGAWWGHTTATSPVRFTYAAIPACPPPAIFGWTQVQSIEQNASHEIIEALTDPDPLAPAYAITDPSSPFHYMGTEIGDLCVGLTTTEAGFTAQRAWSDRAASSGRAPCVPAPDGDVFFSASPASSAPLAIGAGQQRSVTVTGWATGARGPWSVAAASFPGYDATLSPTGSLDRASLGVGDTATLTVRVPQGAASGSRGILVVDSLTVGAGGTVSSGPYEWPVLVEVP